MDSNLNQLKVENMYKFSNKIDIIEQNRQLNHQNRQSNHQNRAALSNKQQTKTAFI